MPQIKQTKPPKTEVLSVTREELSEPSGTPPNSGLAEDVESVQAPVSEEPIGEQPFTLDEGGEPIPEELPPEELGEPGEPKGDPLEDTKRAYHEATERASRLEKILSAMVAGNQLGVQPGAPQAPQILPEMMSMDPTEEERLDPTKYVRRVMAVQEMKNQYNEAMREMNNFVDTHPDWQDLYAEMTKIRNEMPWITQAPGALNRLYKLAKDREELEGYRGALKSHSDDMVKAGAQMEKAKQKKVFVSPGAAAKPRTGRPSPPADFATWPHAKRMEWLAKNGYVKEDIF